MYDAFSACALFLLKRTFVKAHKGIFLELGAFGAKFAMGSVMAFAVDLDHEAYCFLLAFHSFVFRVRWLRLHAESRSEQIITPIHIRLYPKMLGFF